MRRGGVIGAVRNCVFDTDVHELLLTQLDLLPKLLLPLAGPTPDTFAEGKAHSVIPFFAIFMFCMNTERNFQQ